jgi:hypothetical protein
MVRHKSIVRARLLEIQNNTINRIAEQMFVSTPWISKARLYRKKGVWTLAVRFVGVVKEEELTKP